MCCGGVPTRLLAQISSHSLLPNGFSGHVDALSLGQLGMVQSTGVTQGSGSLRTLSPLGGLGGSTASTHGGGGVGSRPLSLSLGVCVDEQRRGGRSGFGRVL